MYENERKNIRQRSKLPRYTAVVVFVGSLSNFYATRHAGLPTAEATARAFCLAVVAWAIVHILSEIAERLVVTSAEAFPPARSHVFVGTAVAALSLYALVNDPHERVAQITTGDVLAAAMYGTVAGTLALIGIEIYRRYADEFLSLSPSEPQDATRPRARGHAPETAAGRQQDGSKAAGETPRARAGASSASPRPSAEPQAGETPRARERARAGETPRPSAEPQARAGETAVPTREEIEPEVEVWRERGVPVRVKLGSRLVPLNETSIDAETLLEWLLAIRRMYMRGTLESISERGLNDTIGISRFAKIEGPTGETTRAKYVLDLLLAQDWLSRDTARNAAYQWTDSARRDLASQPQVTREEPEPLYNPDDDGPIEALTPEQARQMYSRGLAVAYDETSDEPAGD